MRFKKYILAVSSFAILIGCKVDPKINIVSEDELKEISPAGWPAPVYSFSNNPIKAEVFNLGRELFYDPILSVDNTISCGSCHQQFVAFAHAEHKFSHGINDLLGNRNAPGIFNVTWHNSFMHDGGINHIEVQPIGPIQNPIEMGEKFANVITKLQNSAKYKQLFLKAYGTEEATDSRVLKSMAQFMGLMYSYNSKFDHYKRNEDNVKLTEEELRGYNLFQAKCVQCHVEPLFSDFSFRNNGIAIDPLLNDSGRAHITGLPQDRYKFKTPSLRNVGLTGPYMHDGRYTTLQQCLDHYTNLQNTINHDPLMPIGGIPLTAQEKTEIIAFLHTLTDYEFINDQKFADPNGN
ncbi:MAG: cytochrome-c peroxidase [Bacteroidia bacterium]|nr:cytochrome-c peroxidase [Sphingobacteriaceae bacterium]MBP9070478.1 cytochrome-c peroxidase [Bacteroidia bacterium]